MFSANEFKENRSKQKKQTKRENVTGRLRNAAGLNSFLMVVEIQLGGQLDSALPKTLKPS